MNKRNKHPRMSRGQIIIYFKHTELHDVKSHPQKINAADVTLLIVKFKNVKGHFNISVDKMHLVRISHIKHNLL